MQSRKLRISYLTLLGFCILFSVQEAHAVSYVPTQAAGGGGGLPSLVECASNEVLAGVFGNAGQYIDSVGIYCVKVKTDGTWDGEVRVILPKGGGGGTLYDRKCARNSAVMGFKGNAASFVDRLAIECRPLSSATVVTGSTSVLPAAGGTGGTPFGPNVCPNNKAAAAVILSTGLFVDNFRLACRP